MIKKKHLTSIAVSLSKFLSLTQSIKKDNKKDPEY